MNADYLVNKPLSILQVFCDLAILLDCLPVHSTFKPKKTCDKWASLRFEFPTELRTTARNLAKIKVNENTD